MGDSIIFYYARRYKRAFTEYTSRTVTYLSRCKHQWRGIVYCTKSRPELTSKTIFKLELACCDGWQREGNSCSKKCPEGTYGTNCEKRCKCILNSNFFCTPNKGQCFCKPGWTGEKCMIPCEPGKFGMQCREDCPCRNGAGCNPVDGTCFCPPGWGGLDCSKQCPHGWYGPNCTEKCSCEGGLLCDRRSGRCCERTSKSTQNRICPGNCPGAGHHTAGNECELQCKCSNSYTCEPINGLCQCKSGWKPPYCRQPCDPGTYGLSCAYKCGCSLNATCDLQTGSCDTPVTERHINEIAIATVALIGLVILALLSLIVCICCRKRRKRLSRSGTTKWHCTYFTEQAEFSKFPYDENYENTSFTSRTLTRSVAPSKTSAPSPTISQSSIERKLRQMKENSSCNSALAQQLIQKAQAPHPPQHQIPQKHQVSPQFQEQVKPQIQQVLYTKPPYARVRKTKNKGKLVDEVDNKEVSLQNNELEASYRSYKRRPSYEMCQNDSETIEFRRPTTPNKSDSLRSNYENIRMDLDTLSNGMVSDTSDAPDVSRGTIQMSQCPDILINGGMNFGTTCGQNSFTNDGERRLSNGSDNSRIVDNQSTYDRVDRSKRSYSVGQCSDNYGALRFNYKHHDTLPDNRSWMNKSDDYTTKSSTNPRKKVQAPKLPNMFLSKKPFEQMNEQVSVYEALTPKLSTDHHDYDRLVYPNKRRGRRASEDLVAARKQRLRFLQQMDERKGRKFNITPRIMKEK
ncbi:uncharacterized protein LOC117125030 isoform X2 [Anneissia japonica]|uniref:uncharacterized protein LOC117125030 isoform X2 n=1 Tax=Anneissia japonica TaxID=1529436 RepID=UPI001425A0C4|nr:uncharacterized protein LOC117125030 isoform X2 [Anneissia japonica]